MRMPPSLPARTRHLAQALICVALLAGCSAETKGPGGAISGVPEIDQPAPEITGEDADGVSFALSDYQGQVVVVDFWGDW
ncbi:MAG: peroxiredoxin family protein [Pirellulales bacterium]|nr:peroxiredoxin family protein [Pirellulales bacterium]